MIKCVDDVVGQKTPLAKSSYFGLLEESYGYNPASRKPYLAISLTTPAIPRRSATRRYIGVGHVKFDHNDVGKGIFRGKPLETFYNNHRLMVLKHHPILDYFMFIYEFDPENAEITKISDFFIPEKTNWILAFPSGIEYISRDPSHPDLDPVAIFYGDHDSGCRMVVLEPERLDSLLHIPVFNVDAIDVVSILPGPGFYFLPELCSSDTGLCEWLVPSMGKIIFNGHQESLNWVNTIGSIDLFPKSCPLINSQIELVNRIGGGADGNVFSIKLYGEQESRNYVAKVKSIPKSYFGKISNALAFCSYPVEIKNNVTGVTFPVPPNSTICDSVITEPIIGMYVNKYANSQRVGSSGFIQTISFYLCPSLGVSDPSNLNQVILVERATGSLDDQKFLLNLKEDNLKYVYTQILEAMVLYQEDRIVHEDLHCGNILYQILRDEIIIKISDWGFSVKFETREIPRIIGNKHIILSAYKDWFPNYFNTFFDLATITMDLRIKTEGRHAFLNDALLRILINVPGNALDVKIENAFIKHRGAFTRRVRRESASALANVTPTAILDVLRGERLLHSSRSSVSRKFTSAKT
jgi:hypothetical protein